MKKQNFKAGLLIVFIGLLIFHMTASAEVYKLNISQIMQDGNDVYLYLSALDSAGLPSQDLLSADQFAVNIDNGQSLPVLDAADFQSLNQGISYVFCIDISRSLTETEMEQIRESIGEFIDRMSPNDYARIITIGTEIESVCDATQDHAALHSAIQSIASVADYTYLYKGLSFALDGLKKNVDIMPDRAAIILFSDGMDASDGASNEEQVLIDIAETRIPIYVVGMKGNDSSASLNSVGQIARQSGGSIFSYNDMSVQESVQAVQNIMQKTYQLHVQPDESDFGRKNLVWNVTYSSDGYSVQSSSYVYSLGMDDVVFAVETESETTAPESETARQVMTELVTEAQTEPELSVTEKVTGFVQENMIIILASVLVIIALIIMLVLFLQKRKKNREFVIEPSDFNGRQSDRVNGNFEKTLDDLSCGDERTIGDLNMDMYDDEKTVDGSMDSRLRLEFEITFDGQTEIVERVMNDELILGRGNECDVDVVLHSPLEERKQTSRKHAYILNRPDGLYVRNNSRNNTYLNGVEVVGEMALRDKDVLQMGKAVVKLRIRV